MATRHATLIGSLNPIALWFDLMILFKHCGRAFSMSVPVSRLHPSLAVRPLVEDTGLRSRVYRWVWRLEAAGTVGVGGLACVFWMLLATGVARMQRRGAS
jgi:hypothetical protein